MDAFFASVEILERPELADKPVIVGGTGKRGVVASCNYEARRYGIRSAMPSMRAKALCPHAVFLPGRYHDYEKYSALMNEILLSFTPLVEQVSIDEAFLDVAGARALFGEPREIAWAVRTRIWEELSLSASVGAATTKHLAKLASEAAKPNAERKGVESGTGVFVVEAADAVEFLHSLPVRALWGVGRVTAEKLEKMGITTTRQLARVEPAALVAMLGEASANHLYDLAWNRDDREVVVSREAKSIGHEQTFAENLHTDNEVHERIVRLADAVVTRMRRADKVGRTITVKVRFGDFRTITRSLTLSKATVSPLAISSSATQLVRGVDVEAGVRLIGLSMSNLEDLVIAEQTSLERHGDDVRLDATIDQIKQRYGAASVVPALLIRDGKPQVLRKGERQWGPSE